MNETLYRELSAKCILFIYENSKYMSLKKSESPDWIDETNDIGLEVALATNRKIQQVARINLKKTISDKEREIVNRLGRYVTINDKKVFFSHTITGNTIERAFFNTINDKNKKLYKQYKKFNNNELFIFISDPLTNIDDVITMINDLPNYTDEVTFSTMYFFIDGFLIKYITNTKKVCYYKKIDFNPCIEIIRNFEELLLSGEIFEY